MREKPHKIKIKRIYNPSLGWIGSGERFSRYSNRVRGLRRMERERERKEGREKAKGRKRKTSDHT